MSALKAIADRLNRGIGLDAGAMSSASLRLVVQGRMKARGLSLIEEYQDLVARSAGEWQQLVEAVVVPETWFFRDRQPFLALGRWAVEEWLPANPSGVLRLLSMPCSTGEEPYSMTMALLDAGLPPERFSVEAVDISDLALGRARAAIYRRNSFRGQHLDYRDRFFVAEEPGEWRLKNEVKRQVLFRHGNLHDPSFFAMTEPKAVIFCRNLLIYLDRISQRQMLEGIRTLLLSEGLVFAGHAEAYLFSSFGFEAAQMPMAFAFRKRKALPRPKVVMTPKAMRPRVAEPVGRTAPFEAPPPPPVPVVPVVPQVVQAMNAGNLLDEAQRLADAGHLQKAKEKAEASLNTDGPTARAFCLLGLLADATGLVAEAAAMYRKALYLDPKHHEALAHLSLLTKKNGDAATARRLQERLLRLDR